MSEKSESRIQAEIILWYNNTYCLKHHNPRCMVFSIPNGGFRNKLEAITLKSTGSLSGASDLIVIHKIPDKNAILAFVEVKKENGVQSTEQMDFERRVKDLGFIYRVVYSLDQFKSLILDFNNI